MTLRRGLSSQTAWSWFDSARQAGALLPRHLPRSLGCFVYSAVAPLQSRKSGYRGAQSDCADFADVLGFFVFR